jgi:putative DNA primase/helicase
MSQYLYDVFSEAGLAERFALLHADDIRYMPETGLFLRWSGSAWVEHPSIIEDIGQFIATVCEAAADLKVTQLHKLQSLRTARAVAGWLESHTPIMVPAADMDSDPWLLNTPGGTVDLTGPGLVTAPNHRHHVSRSTTVAPTERPTPAPMWEECITLWTCGDHDLMAYLQRLAGYCLTGAVGEHALPIFVGQGGNGKGVFLDVIKRILGSYASTISSRCLESGYSGHAAWKLALKGARLIHVDELSEKRLDVPLLKELSGGSRLRADPKGGRDIEWSPTHKFIFCSNHHPSFSSVDNGLARRLQLVPWSAKIAREDMDRTLGDRLYMDEGPAILRWMIQGCVAWRQHGLQPPESVTRKTEDHLGYQDALGAFLEERCIACRGSKLDNQEMLDEYAAWCEEQRYRTPSARRLANEMRDKGYVAEKHPRTRRVAWLDITWRPLES